MTIKTHKGFSLVEMVIYIAILVAMLVIVVQVVFSITRTNRVIKAARTLETSAILALERISLETRKAESIDTLNSTLGSNPGTLSLDGEDDGGAPYSLDFYLSGGRVQMRENGVEAGALTHASATVTSLIFRRFYASSTEGVRVEMVVESGTSTAYRTETFYSSVLLR
jgi:type II secretory pathway pseudopilin PulG